MLECENVGFPVTDDAFTDSDRFKAAARLLALERGERTPPPAAKRGPVEKGILAEVGRVLDHGRAYKTTYTLMQYFLIKCYLIFKKHWVSLVP